MLQDVPLAALLLKGLVLGWSVAWPPGPINAEMIRRGLSRGFWPAYSLGLGACSGDFLWALGVATGAGAVASEPGVRAGLGIASFGLLLCLASMFLLGAYRSSRFLRRGEPIPGPRRLESSRRGYLLGLTLALSSPWNIAFWLAVIGGQAAERLGLAASLVLALSVVSGAAAWGLVLCSALRLGARFATPAWDVFTRGATGLLLLFFAARLLLRLTQD